MAREAKGESGVMQAWLETSITGLHTLVGRIQVYSRHDNGGSYVAFQGVQHFIIAFLCIRLVWDVVKEAEQALLACGF